MYAVIRKLLNLNLCDVNAFLQRSSCVLKQLNLSLQAGINVCVNSESNYAWCSNTFSMGKNKQFSKKRCRFI